MCLYAHTRLRICHVSRRFPSTLFRLCASAKDASFEPAVDSASNEVVSLRC